MARIVEAAAAPAPAPMSVTPATVEVISAPAPSARIQSSGQEPKVTEWVTDSTDGFATEEGVPAEGGADPEVAAVTETPVVEGDPAAVVDPPVDAAKAARTARRETLSVLKLETQKRELETRLAVENAERKRLEADAAVPLAKRLKGMSQEEKDLALELLITGGDASDSPSPAVAAAKLPPELEALQRQVDAMRAKLEEQETVTQSARIQQAVVAVSEMTADLDVPLLHAYGKSAVPLEGANGRTGYQLVLGTAHQLWEQSGKRGSASDYVADAAARVEAYLDAGYAPAIEAGVKKRGAAATNTVPTPKTSQPAALGKRTAARPAEVSNDLPMNRAERDAQIKKEMGW